MELLPTLLISKAFCHFKCPDSFLMSLCSLFHTFISSYWSYQKVCRVKRLWSVPLTNDGVHSCQSLSWKRLPVRTGWIWSQLYWTVTNLPALTWKEALAVPCVCCTMLTRQPGDSLRLSLSDWWLRVGPGLRAVWLSFFFIH